MKKLIIAAAIVCAAAMSQAASVVWKTTGSATEKGYSVYLVMAAGEWSSAADVAKDSIGGGTLAVPPRGGDPYATGTAANASLTKSTSSLIAVVVTSDGNKYATTSVNVAGLVYDPNAQPPESSPGTATFSVTGLTYKDFTTVPEPTSGLLLLLGVAGLALKRKRA